MRLIAHDELKPLKGIAYSKTQLWRLERENKFPKRVPLGAHSQRYGYVEAEIDKWIAERIAERDHATQAA